MHLRFVQSESTFSYFEATRGYIERHGKPMAFYSDKASVDRSKKMPKRRAQARVQEQLKAINPVLANPEEFRASLKR